MKQVRVLIVDDEKDFTQILALALKRQGYEVETTLNGEEAIEKCHNKDFDIIFMDVKLPGKSGVESFWEIRKDKPETRVVMMSADRMKRLLDQQIKSAAWNILRKPFDMKDLLKMLKEL